GQLQRRLDDLAEGELAVARQRRQPGVRRAGDDRALGADRDLAALFVDEALAVGRAAPVAQAADRDEVARFPVVDDDRRDAAEVAQVGQQDVDADTGRNASVDRVAALAQDAHRRFGRQVVTAGRGEMPGQDGWSLG